MACVLCDRAGDDHLARGAITPPTAPSVFAVRLRASAWPSRFRMSGPDIRCHRRYMDCSSAATCTTHHLNCISVPDVPDREAANSCTRGYLQPGQLSTLQSAKQPLLHSNPGPRPPSLPSSPPPPLLSAPPRVSHICMRYPTAETSNQARHLGSVKHTYIACMHRTAANGIPLLLARWLAVVALRVVRPRIHDFHDCSHQVTVTSAYRRIYWPTVFRWTPLAGVGTTDCDAVGNEDCECGYPLAGPVAPKTGRILWMICLLT